jgi:hypothetical protein
VTSAPVRIGVLKHRAAGDPLAARRRLESVLDQADLEPTGLGPGATLYVRRLDDPRPRTLDLTGPGPPVPAWGEAVASLLEGSLRRAVRPALGAVPSSADAVLFMDEAERISCLVNDWIRGLVSQRWWWRVLDTRTGPRDVVLGALVERPRNVPAVLNRLAGDRMAEPFLRRLEVQEARRVAEGVLESFGLAGLVEVLRRIAGRGPLAAGRLHPGPPRGGASIGRLRQTPRSAEPRREPPWATLVPEAAALSDLPMHQFLLGVSLGLLRAGSIVRAPAFASAAVRWSRQPGRLPSRDRGTGGMPERSVRIGEPKRISSYRRTADGAAREPRTAQPIGAVRHTAAHTRIDVERRGASADRAAGNTAPVDIESIDAEALRPTPPVRARPDSLAAVGRPGLDGETTIALPRDRADSTRTHLGGVLYLLNVALSIGLYSDFTRPATPGIALDPWDFVALVARRLGADDLAPDDPIWPLLDQLSGRGWHTRPGHGFRPAADWRIDPGWVRPFKADRRAWRWSTAHGRVVVGHPAGFRILDVRTSLGLDGAAVRRLLENYRPHPRLRAMALPRARRGPSLERWLDNITDYVRARLIRAIAVPDASRLAEVVFRHDAQVQLTASAVDVRLSLDDLPIAVRAAGLDRDPGWIPAARRAVTFHYA